MRALDITLGLLCPVLGFYFTKIDTFLNTITKFVFHSNQTLYPDDIVPIHIKKSYVNHY